MIKLTPEETTLHQLKKEKESALRAELSVHGYNPSPIISKDILISMLMQVYFGGGKL